jgi:nucleoside phosphorylase
VKKLLVFAHKGEAIHFLKTIPFTPIDFFFMGLFESSDFYLLITGEGLQSASEKTVSVLSIFNKQISEIYNMGTAGSLSNQVSVDQIVWVQTAIAGSHERREYKTFTSSHPLASITCISANERVETTEARDRLSPFANIVDREVWAIASAAALFKIPFFSIKYISDDCSSENFCKEVIQKAPQISANLHDFFIGSVING